jgi:RNA-splicing ligase RtcB|nr:MAG TPA: tRNA-splicing ligase RtcB [Bacteriophage sp.]
MMSNLKIFTKNVEQEAVDQIELLLAQDAFKDCKVRIMPDVHAGKGCVIGFTADLGEKVIPNIVGVDIGCGMLCVSLGQTDIDFEKLDNVIRSYVPSGRDVHEGRIIRFDELQELKCYRELRDTKRLERSIGTLGGGNHFIEVDVAEDGYKYLVIHTGSRNLGKQVADYYQNLAVELMSGKDKLYEEQDRLIKEYKSAGRKSEIQSAIAELHRNFKAVNPNIPKDLCYLEGKYREDYLHDMRICQKFAYINRVMIAQIICNHMGWGVDADMPDYFECIHNYIDHDSNIVRKGAISAKYGEKVLIPINMRDGCIIGTGKGNEDWNCSAPHGAGRVMSRTKAKELVSLEEFEKSMDGIYTTSVNQSTIDESPMAYKTLDEIVENIKDTVDVLAIIKPVYNFKASE